MKEFPLFINPEQVRNNARYYAEKICEILMACYGPDYPTPAGSIEKNIAAIQTGCQQTCLWALTQMNLEHEKYGTASIVSAESEFGSGVGEMGKSGSTGSAGSQFGYIEFTKLWLDSPVYLAPYDTMVQTVRNCPARPGKKGNTVKAGRPIRLIFLKYMNETVGLKKVSQQWGIAPWYLMPDESDGAYEVLDLLTMYRNPTAVKDFFQNSLIFLERIEDRQLLAQFSDYNFGMRPNFSEVRGDDDVLGDNWCIIEPSHMPEKNPAKLVLHGGENTNSSFHTKYHELQGVSSCMDAVHLPIHIDTRENQRLLFGEGHTLTGFFPSQNGIFGTWSKLKTDRPLINPSYIDSRPDDYSPDWYKNFVRTKIKELHVNREL